MNCLEILSIATKTPVRMPRLRPKLAPGTPSLHTNKNCAMDVIATWSHTAGGRGTTAAAWRAVLPPAEQLSVQAQAELTGVLAWHL